MNHLEQLVAEWLEYRGYFVRRNVNVGRRANGGYECELDVVAFNPQLGRLVHYEPSTDTFSWARREERYIRKFTAGRRYIPGLFPGMNIPEHIEQYALFLYGSKANHQDIAGGHVLMVGDFLHDIVDHLKDKPIAKGIVPEQYPLLRMIHLSCEYRESLWNE